MIDRLQDPHALVFLAASLLVVLSLGCSVSTPARASGASRIELLGFAGCPNTPILHDRLARVTDVAGIGFTEVDLESLPSSDARRRFPAPTVLVDGRDLFGLAPSQTGEIGCRVYPGGVPSEQRIATRLRDMGAMP